MKNLRELPKFRDGLSYLYVEHGRIEQRHQSIAWYGEEGEMAIPCASLGVLLLGPGTSITHAAVRALADNGCSACWVGEDGVRFYASGTGETRSSRNLLLQAAAWADESRHMQIVETMYRMRFRGPLPRNLSLRQIRGMEGVRVRDAYAGASRQAGVPWHGRNYDRTKWSASDPINRALSAGFACMYGICHAGILSAGYSPALGFIHTGKQLSFVYDVADLYKVEMVVPIAFQAVAESELEIERRVRLALRNTLRETHFLRRVVDDLTHLFQVKEDAEGEDFYEVDGAKPGALWDPTGDVEGGVGYGHGCLGERPDIPARGTDTMDA